MKRMVEDIKNNWVLLAFVCAIIIWYANTNSRLSTVEAEVSEVESTLQTINDIKTDIAVMKTDIGYIKGRVK
jgi:hypothetical protein